MSASTVPAERRPYAPRMAAGDRREQLLDVARELVAHGGVDAVTIDAVAKAAGVTRPVVYTHFTDAGDLLEALLRRETEWARGCILALVPPDPSGTDPVEAFTALAQGYLEAVAANPDRWRPILLPAEGIPAAVQDFKREADLLVQERVVATLRSLSGPDTDADLPLLARMLMAMAEEAGRMLVAEPDAYPLPRVTAMARYVVDMLQRQLSQS